MKSLARAVPLFCMAGLFGVLSGCSDDDGETLESDVGNVKGSDAGKIKDAGQGDGGKGKDAGVGRDAKVDPGEKEDASVNTGCGSVRAEAKLERGPVDIVLALDSSGSMAGQICNVSKNLTEFAAGVGVSAHVVSVYEMGVLGLVTGTLCGSADPLAATPLAMDASRYLHRSVNVDSWNALEQLDADFPNYQSFLRPDAPTHFLVVSDDQSRDVTAAQFKTQMEGNLGHDFIFHAIVADGQNGCRGSSVGTEYLTLADETGGEKLPICATDWSALFKQLEAAVVSSAPIPCDFEIPASPNGTLDTDAVQVVFKAPDAAEEQFPRAADADKCADKTAWYYNDPAAPTRVQLCPAACEAVKQGGDVNIAFGCEPIMVL